MPVLTCVQSLRSKVQQTSRPHSPSTRTEWEHINMHFYFGSGVLFDIDDVLYSKGPFKVDSH